MRMNNLKNEYITLENELKKLEEETQEYPKGSLRKRIINGRSYYYLQYRDGNHVKSDYIVPERITSLQIEIEERKKRDERIKQLKKRLDSYAKILGIHRTYHPVKNVDYEDYTLFMSKIAHDYKSLGRDGFMEKYDVSKYRGINKRYLSGFIDYINGIERENNRKTNDLVLDPYTYLMYFKYDQKQALQEGLKHAIPAFLARGLLITEVQETVRDTQCTRREFIQRKC